MSALPPKADIRRGNHDVGFVPKADILQCGRNWRYSITNRISVISVRAGVRAYQHRN
jgi:hypothetical protein